MKANNNKNSRGKWGLRALLACAAGVLLVLGGCTRDGIDDGYGNKPGGIRNTTLRFDMSSSTADEKTRGVLDAGALKLETVWLGVFDTKTGQMVGSYVDRPRKNDGTRVKVGDGSTWTVDGLNIWYYENNPEVYIASVVNFDYIDARKVGDDTTVPLYKLLGIKEYDADNKDIPELETEISWSDLRNISVVTSSIDEAMDKMRNIHQVSPKEEMTLAMGFFNTSAGTHTMFDRDGNVNSNARIPLTEGGEQFAAEIDLSGRVYLRRLQSDIDVNINFSSTYSYDVIQEVNSLRYKIVNKPVEVYLAEHAVDQIGGTLTGKDNYLSRTSNSADWLEINESGTGYTSDENWTTINGSIEDGYSFSYSHYENKHWGVDWEMEPGTDFGGYRSGGNYLPRLGSYDENDEWVPDTETRSWKEYLEECLVRYFGSSVSNLRSFGMAVQATASHRIREAKISTDDEIPLFKSLVKNKDNASFNNNASYILLEADMTWKNAMDGAVTKSKIYYTIHEGYTSHADGTAVLSADRLTSKNDIYDAICDFQSARNTKYTYNITISGVSLVSMQATRSDDDTTMHDDGVTGSTWRDRDVIVEIEGEGNIDTYGRGRNGGVLYRFYDPKYNYDYQGYIPLYGMSDGDYASRKEFTKWRLYEKRGDTGEFNYGTCSPENKFSWPAITGEYYGLADLENLPDTDPMKKFYNSISVHVGFENYYNSEYIEYESLFDMSLDDFVNGAERDILKLYPNYSLYYFITVDAYSIKAEVDELPDYRRGLYIVSEAHDFDGCTYAYLLGGFEQNPQDWRLPVYWFEPMLLQSRKYDNYHTTGVDFNVYSSVHNFVKHDYIRWYAGVSFYNAEDDDQTIPNEWYDYYEYLDYDLNPHEPLSYEIWIDGVKVDEVPWDSEYRRCNYYDTSYSYSSDYSGLLHLANYNEQTSFYFEWPYEPDNYSVGDHKIEIVAKVDERYVRPVKIEQTLHISEQPLWVLNDYSYPIQYRSNSSGDFFYYAGMMLVYGQGLSTYNSVGRIDFYGTSYNYGIFNEYESSDNDYGVVRFKIDQHGKFRIRATRSGSSDYKYFVFSARNKSGNRQVTLYCNYSSYNNYWFDTRDIIDNFDDGPVDVAIYLANKYTYSYYLYINEIEWVTDENQSPSYPGQLDYTDRMETEDSYYVRHPYYPYSYNNQFYLTPGITNYFGFYDTDARVQKYKVGVYETSSITSSTTALFEQEFDAEDILFSVDNGGISYFMCPLHVPYGRLNDGWEYYVAVTPVADDYATKYAVKQARVSYNSSNAIEWWDPSIYYWSYYTNPWYYDSGQYKFYNEAGEWSEYNGLILHGGTASMDVNESSINFGGAGYPAYTRSTPDHGRYLSFTTEKSGLVVLRSNTSNADRYFCLYAMIDGEPVLRDRKAIVVGGQPFSLSTGRVDGPTEFFICPEGGVGMNGARFVFSDEADDRESLDDSKIAYSNWSTDPEKPIHPGMYDIVYNLDDEYQYEYKEFPLSKHFGSNIAFSDSNPRATSYTLQLFYEPTFSNQNFDRPAWTTEIDAAECETYTGADGSKVFTFNLFFGQNSALQTGEYLAFLTPVGDPDKYRTASPQFLTVVDYYDWTNPREYDDGYYDEDDPYYDIYMSPGMGWIAPYFSFTNTDDYYLLPEEKELHKGDYIDYVGLSLNGSGTETARAVRIVQHNKQTDGKPYGDITDWWMSFPGQGYPKVQGDGNVGEGRNLTFTTDIAGKIVLLARADQSTQRYYGLYKKTGSTVTQVGESQPVLADYSDDVYTMKCVQFETGDVSEQTEFIICPEGGSSELFEIIFFTKGSAAYEYDWTQGYPYIEDEDDDDDNNNNVDGYRMIEKFSISNKLYSSQSKLAKQAAAKIPFRK